MKLRLFFALWPGPETRDALAAAAQPLLGNCRGRRVPVGNYHLTLAFLGAVAGARLDELREAAATVSTAPFQLVFDRRGHWPGPRVAWLGCRHMPPAAEALAQRLWATLEPLGFRPDPRPFRPHLTVLRGCRDCNWEGAIGPVDWPVTEFTLVRSDTLPAGPRYTVIERWPLAFPAKPATIARCPSGRDVK